MPEIQSRMAEYEEGQIEFSILGLVKDPITTLTSEFAVNLKKLAAINQRLRNHASSQEAGSSDFDLVNSPEASLPLTPDLLNAAIVPGVAVEQFELATDEELMELRQQLLDSQEKVRSLIKEEEQSRHADEDYANKRRHDYGPAVRTWVRSLARKGLLEQLATNPTAEPPLVSC